METSTIIKTQINVRRSPKFNVNKQLPYVGIEVLLMNFRLGPFWVFRCVCEYGTTLTSAPCRSGILVLRHSQLYKISDFVYGQQRSSPLVAGQIVSPLGAWRCAFPGRISKMSVVPTYPTLLWWRMWLESGIPVASAVASAPPSNLYVWKLPL